MNSEIRIRLRYGFIVATGIILIVSASVWFSTRIQLPASVLSVATQSASPVEYFSVTHVVDGDTVTVDIHGKKETIRLIGIDTPETVDPRKPVQCFGREASDKTKELLSGKRVILEADSTQGERDKYKRLLRYVRLEDGTLINELLIREGYAHEYTYQSNPYKYQTDFQNAELSARKNKKGLWADTACRS